MELSHQTLNAIRDNRLFKKGQVIIIGLSGGPDSTALVHILHRINTHFKMDWRLVIAHLNHQMRGRKSDRDEAFARKMADSLGIPIYVGRKNIIRLSRRYKQSLEETARNERYRFFESAADRLSQKTSIRDVSIAVGHNLDDNAETVLFRIIRGTGLKGLRGIVIKRPLFDGSKFQLIRPLIIAPRRDIISYLNAKKIAYRIDHTNRDKKILRNRIRHELLPLLDKYNPAIRSHLVNLAETAAGHYEYLTQAVKKYRLDKNAIPLKRLKKEHPVMQVEMIKALAEKIPGAAKAMTYKHYLAILKMIGSPNPSGRVDLPVGIAALITNNNLLIKNYNNRQKRIF